MRSILVPITSVVMILGAMANSARGQCAFEWKLGDGVPGVTTPGGMTSVRAMTLWDPDGAGPQSSLLVVGGQFTIAGNVVANNIAVWDGTSWSTLGTGMNSTVFALTVYNGKLIAGGLFTTAGGSAANFIAQWDGTSWSAVGTGMDNVVAALAVFNGNLIAAGNFTNAGGTSASRIAQWNGSSWSALGTGMNNTVQALTVYNGNLIAGGSFATAGGTSANNIALWNGNSWSSFGTGMNSVISAVTVYNGNLVAAGNFTTAGGTSANGIAQWNGSSWSALGTGMDAAVLCLSVYNGNLIAGGNFFTTAGGVSAKGIAQWNGTSWSAFDSATSVAVSCLTVYANNLIAGGGLISTGSVGVSRIAQWNGSSWSALGTGMNNTVQALTVYNGNLIAGGSFTSAGNTSAKEIAQWNGSTWSFLGSGMDNQVAGLTVYSGNLIAGGFFSTAGGVSASRIAQWNGSSWSPLGTGMNGSVLPLTVYNGKLIAGGGFTTAGGSTANFVAQWDGTSWSALGTGMGNSVLALAVFNGNLVAGGGFTTAGGVSANNIAQWNGSSWSALSSGANGSVNSLTVYNGNLIAGGSFTSAGGVSASRIAQWNGSSWSALGTGMNNTVQALTVYNGNLIAGGSFTTAGAASANDIAQWNGSSWSALGAGTNSTVNALAVFNTDLFAGGFFTTAGGNVSAYSARWGASPGQTRLYVDASATGADNGTSWTDAYRSLSTALTNLCPTTVEIWVADGTYTPDGGYTPSGGARVGGSLSRSATFQLPNGVAVYGGFAGTETLLSQRATNPDGSMVNVTTLSGDLNGNDGANFANNGENSYHVVTGSGTDSTAVLDGFTVTGGNANGPGPGHDLQNGAGLFNNTGSPTINNCSFVANACSFTGAAINNWYGSSPTITNCRFNNNGSGTFSGGAISLATPANVPPISNVTIVNCSFTDNSSTAEGGAVSVGNDNSKATITNCTFTNNSSVTGGAFISGGTGGVSLTNCTFTNNSASSKGGGAYVNSSNPTFSGCTFISNTAQFGGGMDIAQGSPMLVGSRFIRNTAGSGAANAVGGAINNESSTTTLVNCLLIGNTSQGLPNQGGGGAIHNVNNAGPTASFAMTNCLLTGNYTAGQGGAIGNSSSAFLNLSNCTFANNTAGNGGGGLYNVNGGNSNINNSIFWGNAANQIQVAGGIAAAGNSDIQGGYAGAGNINSDPIFVGGTSGTWTAAPTYNSSTGQSTLTNAAGAFTPGAFVGKILNPKTSQNLQSMIISNTATTVTVWGDLTGTNPSTNTIWGIANGTSYQFYDYHLGSGSPCVNTGINSALPADVADLDADSNTSEALPLDLDLNSRVVATTVDMGAYEFTPALTACFTATPNPVTCPQTITLNGSCSTGGPGHNIVLYSWDFDGDGTTDANTLTSSVTYSYPHFGTFTAHLTVTNDASQSASTTKQITVNLQNHVPVAISGSNQTIDVGDSLHLDGSASFDQDVACGDLITSYAWDLTTDGTPDVTGVQPTVSWAQLNNAGITGPGTYTVTLRVTDSFGGTGSASFALTVYLNQVNAVGSATPATTGCDGATTFHHSLSTQSDPRFPLVLFTWDFGDNTPVLSTSNINASVPHTYAAAGGYFATLTVTDSNNHTGTAAVVVNANLTPSAGLAITAVQPTLCPSNTGTAIAVASSESGVSYQLRNGTTNVGIVVAGTGGTINLPTGVLAATTTFNVLATRGTCSMQLMQTATVTVQDATPPVITITGGTPIAFSCRNSLANQYIEQGATALDACDGALTVGSPSYPEGFPNSQIEGTYHAVYSATDAAGHTITVTRTIIVNENAPLLITNVPANLTVECQGGGGAPASYAPIAAFLAQPQANDQCDTDATLNNDAPANFLLGTTTVTWTASHAGFAPVTASRTVTVQDTTAPTITDCGVNQSITADLTCSASVPDFTSAVVATDVCTNSPTITQSPPAGSSVSGVGNHPVTLTVSDPSNNSVGCTRTLMLTPPVVSINAGGPYQTCNHDPIALNGSATSGVNVTWTTSGDGSFGNAASPTTTYTPGAGDVTAGSVTLTLTATGNAACVTGSSSGNLTVLSTPTIVTPPVGATIGAHAPYTFSVVAGGGALHYQWKHDGNDISGATAYTYNIASALGADAGDYTVVVSNVCGNVTSSPATLIINNEATLTLSGPTACVTSSTFSIDINMTGATVAVQGAQIFLHFDPVVLHFVSRTSVAPFNTVVQQTVDQINGNIDISPIIQAPAQPTMADSTLIRLNFSVTQDVCTPQSGLVTFRTGPNGAVTKLTTLGGDAVAANTVNLGSLHIDHTPPVLTCPSDINVNADAGLCTASLTPSASATDNCGTPTVTGVRGDGQALSDPYPQGATNILWTATDACGNGVSCTQHINVSPYNEMLVSLQLAGVHAPADGPPLVLHRCIRFELLNCPNTTPTLVDQVLTFSSPDASHDAVATSASVLVPCGAYSCLTARDRLHTLRRTLGSLPTSGSQFVADFVTVGKPLVGGNLNDDTFIDILDFGKYASQYNHVYSPPLGGNPGDTNCSTPFPHADISGNGTVFTEDFTFIQVGFLKTSDSSCCSPPGFAMAQSAVGSISVADLKAQGKEDLAIGDVNGDGVLDVKDITAWMQGARPGQPLAPPPTRKR